MCHSDDIFARNVPIVTYKPQGISKLYRVTQINNKQTNYYDFLEVLLNVTVDPKCETPCINSLDEKNIWTNKLPLAGRQNIMFMNKQTNHQFSSRQDIRIKIIHSLTVKTRVHRSEN